MNIRTLTNRHLLKLFSSLTLAVVLLLTYTPACLGGGDGSFALVVNAKNSYSADQAKAIEMVKQLYLKNRSSWEGGKDAKPFGRPDDSDEQKAFLSKVLNMSQAELAAHWLSLKQKTGQTPPRAMSSENMLGKMISKYEGAFGVLTKQAAEKAGDKVKVLFTF